MFGKALRIALISALFSVASVAPASALTLTFFTNDNPLGPNDRNEGFYDISNTDYLNLGINWSYTNSFSGANWDRGFYSFDLNSLSAALTNHTLVSATFHTDVTTVSGSGVMNLFDVSTDALSLNTVGASSAIFADLGSGFVYAQSAVLAQQSNAFVLNAQALTDITAAAGGWFSLGSSALTTLGDTQIDMNPAYATYAVGPSSLVLELQDAPEPGFASFFSAL